ncbi:Checkpoint serine/threonine-protein kinase bub1-like protein [Elsinoe fawcettii]|nr:Checkpoint serine/threonine-protein kinase bub1-like protein [Elsinoe fawcettii]
MANREEPPVDFTLLESHKENITSLPSGRSAKALAALYSPPLTSHPSSHSDAHSATRTAFEGEIASIEDSDDPLDVWDRYVKWIETTYPDPASPNAGLCGVLERVTKSLLKRGEYKNDVRYLRLWLRYVRFFAEQPREVFVYLSRNGVGEGLALYYEEFAGWLEGEGRWGQANEVYSLGMERGARPTERLGKRFAEFEARRKAKGEVGERPDSPALPIVRAVLGEKVDPFAAGQKAQGAQEKGGEKKKKAKMAIFADGEAKESVLGSGEGNWDFGTRERRKRENEKEAGKWEGQTLKVGKTNGGMEKMQIFKVSQAFYFCPYGRHAEGTRTNRRSVEQGETSSQQRKVKSSHEAQCTINPRNGKREMVHVNLDVVYTDIGRTKVEFSFEEVMARHRGWLERDWKAENRARDEEIRRMKMTSPEKKLKKKGGFEIFNDSASPDAVLSPVEVIAPVVEQASLPIRTVMLSDENNENAVARPVKDKNSEIAKRMRKEEKANKTRKIKVMEVRHEKKETQTVQLNFASPTGPKLRRRRDATMTINTKEAVDEIYGIFDQPGEEDTSESEEEVDDSDDDYTSGAESTTTGRISAPTSEYGEETRNEILQAHQAIEGGQDDDEESEDEVTTAGERTDNTGWSEFTTSKHVPQDNDSPSHKAKLQIFQDDEDLDQAAAHMEEELITPCEDASSSPPRTMYIPIPPEDYEAPNATYRSRAVMANNRLPFMTPISEQTESSIGTARTEKDYFTSKTPSRQTHAVQPILEDSDEPWSSPFQDQMHEASNNKQFLLKQKKVSSIKALAPLTPPLDSLGPIIPDKQVNPCDPAIRDIILAQMQPTLSTYPGFYDHRSGGENTRLAEIKKYARSVASKKTTNGDKTGTTLSLPPNLTFTGTDNVYTVKRELGCGAFGPVYLVERHTPEQDPTSDRGILEAMKVELTPPSAWEFHMLHLSHLRLSSQPRLLSSLVLAHELHLHTNASFLLESYSPTGTLLDLVNLSRNLEGCNGGTSGGLEESLAMFYTVELLRVIEAMHTQSLIHGDLKADNVMLRLPSSSGSEWSQTYTPDGTAGWDQHGITLIDFGRGIDMRTFRPDVKFMADWPTTDADCVEMRELRGWTWQIDYHGIAGTAHTLLFGKYMSVVPDRSPSLPRSGAGGRRSGDLIDLSTAAGADAGDAMDVEPGREERAIAEKKRWKTRENLKRYWATDIWGEFFSLMLNSASEEAGRGEEGGKMPLVNGMRGVREKMERHLEGVQGLRDRIARVEDAAARRAGKR